MKTKPHLSVVLPVFNESERLHNIYKIAKYVKSQPISSELIIVNDGSTDTTQELLENYAKKLGFSIISYTPNQGKGYALKTGILAAHGTYRLFLDIDLATPIEEYEKFRVYEKKYPVLIGSRRVNGARIAIHQPTVRELMGRFFTLLSQIILGLSITDFTCGFKCFHEKAAINIFSKTTIRRWGCDPEVLFIANKLGYHIKEIPITWKHDDRTRVKFPRDIIISFFELLKIRYNDIIGRY